MATTCSVASGLLAVVGVAHVALSVVLGFIIILVRKETRKRKQSLVHPSFVPDVAQRRRGTVSPPRLTPEREIEKVDLSSSPSRSQITVSEDKHGPVVKYHKENTSESEAPVSLLEAGSLATEEVEPVVLRHKKVSALKEEYAPSGLAMHRTYSGSTTRKISADVVTMERTSSGSYIRKPPGRASTGSSPHRKSRFSVASLLSRKSVDLESETASLILEGQDQQEDPGLLQDGSDDRERNMDATSPADSSIETQSREVWSHTKPGDQSEC